MDAVTVALAAAALLLLGKKKQGGGAPATSKEMVTVTATTPRRTVPQGGEQPIHHTGGDDVASWARERYQAAHDWLVTQGLSDPQAHDIALSALAHWALETNGGAAEYNWNLGGIHARSGDQYFASTDAGVATHFAAYDSLVQAVSDYFELVAKGYPACWELLKSAPAESGWIECLGSHGYYATKDKQGHDTHVPDAWATRRALLAQYAGP